jgi:ABC-2 type transport system permease protein
MAGGAGRPIDAAAVISGKGDRIAVDLWTLNPNDNVLQALLRDRFNEVVRRQQLIDAGVAPAVIAAADRVQPVVTIYSPKAGEGGKVSIQDRLPAVVATAMGLLLWSVIMTGAGILLNSVIEEKSNRILEVLLSSASTAEIMGGKILGVAGVTGTVLGVWITVGGTALTLRAPDMAAGVLHVLLEHGLIVYFALFLVMGYLMYASIFAAIGAFCETSRDAQTLLGPVMLILMVPILFMSQAIVHPDAPILTLLSWIPPFTPFLMVARVASGPPLWQIIGTLLMMAATSAVVVWIAGRAFRAGALSFGKVDRKAIFAMIAAKR